MLTIGNEIEMIGIHITEKVSNNFTARRYASSVYVIVVCLSVLPSVRGRH